MTSGETLEWLRFTATIITPFAVLWLGIRASSRKKLIETIDAKIEHLSGQIEDGNKKCSEDIRAVIAQVSAHQREVSERYPLRHEIEEGFKNVREELRFLYRSRDSHDPNR